ncbi:hypothetical protein BJP27_23965 (plasmid) [Pseudomonas oryzihabitans]|nr:hypothetical protein BJP27_23965 [Pseudomonas psychrotolerans]
MDQADVINLQSDASGFLRGTPLDTTGDRERLRLLRAIKHDTGELLEALQHSVAPVRSAARQAAREARIIPFAAPPARPNRPDAAPSPAAGAAPATQASRRESGARPAPSASRQLAAASRERDSRGRFIGQGGGGSALHGSAGTSEARERREAARDGLISRLWSRVSRGRGMALGNTEHLDPALDALREAGSLAKPLTGLYGSSGQGTAEERAVRKVSVPWYRRLFGELREINKKTERQGLLSRLGNLLSKLPLLGPLLGMLGAMLRRMGLMGVAGAAARALGSAFGGRRARAAGRSDRAARRAERRRIRTQRQQATVEAQALRREKAYAGGVAGGAGAGKAAAKGGRKGWLRLLRRVPVLGALLGAAVAGGSLFGIGDQSREEKFNTVGSTVGAGVGGALGGLLGGPLGAVVGGILGDKIGGMVGDWLATVDWEKVGDKITDAWHGAVDTIKTGWEWCQDKFSGVLDTLSAASDWVREKAGKVRDAVMQNETVQQVVKAAAPVVDAASQRLGDAREAAEVAGGRLVGRLDKGFRHKESYDGIQGGDGLAKYGRYTNDEAARIRELKTSGANTGGGGKGGLSAENRNKIIASAKAAGLDPQAMLEIAAVESGGNPNAISSTGAIGLFQHTGGTASGLGITNRFDVDQNIAGAMKLAQENAAALQKAGLPVTRDNLYMMHQLGPVAAKEIIKGAADGKSMDQLSQGTQAAAGFNIGKGSKTAAQYLQANSTALDSKLGHAVAPTSLKPLPAGGMPPVNAKLPAVASVPPRKIPEGVEKIPSVQVKVAGNDAGRKETPVVIEQPLTQNVGDRGLAHAATGGIGMTPGAR